MNHAHGENMDVRLIRGAQSDCELVCSSPLSAFLDRAGTTKDIPESHVVAELAVHVGPVILACPCFMYQLL